MSSARFSNQVIALPVKWCNSEIFPSKQCTLQCCRICSIDWISPHSHRGDCMKFHLCNKKAQHPCPVRNLLRRIHVRRGRSMPSTADVGSVTNSFWNTDTFSHQCLHLCLRSSKFSQSLKKHQNGFLDFSRESIGADVISSNIGRLLFRDIFRHSLIAASCRVMCAGTMLLRTYNHSTSVGSTAPQTIRKALLICVSWHVRCSSKLVSSNRRQTWS